jgi:hypothetical protein
MLRLWGPAGYKPEVAKILYCSSKKVLPFWVKCRNAFQAHLELIHKELKLEATEYPFCAHCSFLNQLRFHTVASYAK